MFSLFSALSYNKGNLGGHKEKMRLVGRIIMLAVAIGIAATNIPNFINELGVIKTLTWTDIQSIPANFNALIGLLSAAAWLLLAVFALWAAIRGNVGFLTFIICLVGIGFTAWNIWQGFDSGTYTQFTDAWTYIVSMIFPIGYFVGGVMLKLSRKR